MAWIDVEEWSEDTIDRRNDSQKLLDAVLQGGKSMMRKFDPSEIDVVEHRLRVEVSSKYRGRLKIVRFENQLQIKVI